MSTIESLLSGEVTSTERALELYDGLPAVDLDFMIGRWKGAECRTNHPMEGALAASGWYGKAFVSADVVHPLLERVGSRDGKSLYAVDPKHIPVGKALVKLKPLSGASGLVMPALQTTKPKAHLKLSEYRGIESATMVYNDKPIRDIFRKVDDQRVLGAMDLKGDSRPYLFTLQRDDDSQFELEYLKG